MQHIFSFKCALYCGELEYQKICQDTTPPLEISTTKGSNSWKNGCQNSVTIHHCFYEHGATVAKRKENNAAALQLSHQISYIVNNSIIRGHTDHQNSSKCPPYQTDYVGAKKSDIFIVKSEIRSDKPPPITTMAHCAISPTQQVTIESPFTWLLWIKVIANLQ